MNIIDISNDENTKSDLVCRVELTIEEVASVIHSLGRTMCKGDHLTVSMELEDSLHDILSYIKNNQT